MSFPFIEEEVDGNVTENLGEIRTHDPRGDACDTGSGYNADHPDEDF